MRIKIFYFSFYKLIESFNLSIFIIHQAKNRITELIMVNPINIRPNDPKFEAKVMLLYPISLNFGLRDSYQLKGSEGKNIFKIVVTSEPNKSKLES